MRKLFLDFDCTLIDTIECIVDLYNEDFSAYKNFKPLNSYEVNTWDFEELTFADPGYINMYFNQPRFFERIKYMDHAKEIINIYLKNQYDISVVSMGYYPNLKLKERWLNNNMPFVNFIGIDIGEYRDKSHIDMSGGILIDDSYANLISSNASKKLCFGDLYPWNEKWDGVRLYNWVDVKNYLEVIE